MKSLKELENQDLQWRKQGVLRVHHTLEDGNGDVLATMQRSSRWWEAEQYEIDSPGSRWYLQRRGNGQWIEITSVGTGERVAVYRYKEQQLEFQDGRSFYWEANNIWGSKWAWVTEDGEPIIGFKTGGVFQMNSEIAIDPDVDEAKALSLLVHLGWFLLYIDLQDGIKEVAKAFIGVP